MMINAPDIQMEFFAGGAPRPALAHPLPELTTGYERHDAGRSGGLYFDVSHDVRYGVHWATLRQDAPAVFEPALVADLRQGQRDVAARLRVDLARRSPERIRYQVFASSIPGVFSLGGDLRLFRRHILARDRRALREYALSCVDLVHANATSYGLPLTTISLIQGDALGGGFEAALAANVVVAERHCKLGLPEILFNLFPGMGAAQLLARRLPAARAEAFIASGRTYEAEELHALGLVDVLADEGGGEEAVWKHIRTHHRQANGREALRRAFAAIAPLDYECLVRTTDIWVAAALALGPRDVEVIDYLIRAQARRLS
jgi:DSF synthase